MIYEVKQMSKEEKDYQEFQLEFTNKVKELKAKFDKTFRYQQKKVLHRG